MGGRIGFEPMKAVGQQISLFQRFPNGVDYIFIRQKRMPRYLVSTGPHTWGSHGISIAFSFSFHRYPREFILELPLRAAISYSLPSLTTWVPARFQSDKFLMSRELKNKIFSNSRLSLYLTCNTPWGIILWPSLPTCTRTYGLVNWDLFTFNCFDHVSINRRGFWSEKQYR